MLTAQTSRNGTTRYILRSPSTGKVMIMFHITRSGKRVDLSPAFYPYYHTAKQGRAAL